MTDKQIIIDGVNITGCTWCDFEPDAEPYCRINDGEDLACEDNPNCYFKQLARKAQECEELKKQLKTAEKWRIKAEGLNEKLELRNTCYRKTLEEIEEVCKNGVYDEFNMPLVIMTNLSKDIRNKAGELWQKI